MRVNETIREILAKKITAMEDEALKKYTIEDDDALRGAFKKIYISVLNDAEDKLLRSAISKFEKEQKVKIHDKEALRNQLYINEGYRWHWDEYVVTTEQGKIKEKRKAIKELGDEEYNNLMLKLPFVKKEEDLNAILLEIENKINAI